MTDTVKEALHTERVRRTTSIGTWLLAVSIAITLLGLRLPEFIAVAEGALTTATAELGDAQLSGAAIAIGSVTAIALHAIGILLVAAVATVLERFFGPPAVGSKLRIGVGGAALATIVLGQQVFAIIMGVAAVERGWPMWLAGAVVAFLTPLLFPAARTGLRHYARALLVTGVIGGLLCIG